MGLLDGLFGSKVSNPALVSAMEKYRAESSEDNLVDLWQKFLKSKVLLATTLEGAKEFGKIKQIRDAIGLPFNTIATSAADNLLTIVTDNETFESLLGSTAAPVPVTGEQAFQLASAKGLLGMTLNPKSAGSTDLKVWQHQIFVERNNDANKLHSLASKLSRAGNHADAEGVLKAAVAVAQREPGVNHPFTAELNIELARSMKSQGKGNEAEWIYRRALQIYEACGSHDLELASTAEQLGSLLCELKKTSAAAPFLQRALDIYERVPGSKPDSIARILCQIAEAKIDEGKADDAEQFLKRASVNLEEKRHPDLLGILNRLGALCEKEGKPKEALAYYQRSVASFDASKRCREIDLGRAAHHAAKLLMEEKQFGEAEELLEKALQSYRREGSPDDVKAVGELTQILIAQKADDAKAKAEEEDKDKKHSPAYARDNKRPSELPLLDMSAVRSNAKATYVPGMRGETKQSDNERSDPEEQALQQMRAFLDSVDSKPDTGAKPAPQAVAQPQVKPESPTQEVAVENLVKTAIQTHDEELARENGQAKSAAANQSTPTAKTDSGATESTNAQSAKDHPAANTDSFLHTSSHDDVSVDDLFSSVKQVATPTSPIKAMAAEPEIDSIFGGDIEIAAENPVAQGEPKAQEPTITESQSRRQQEELARSQEEQLEKTKEGPTVDEEHEKRKALEQQEQAAPSGDAKPQPAPAQPAAEHEQVDQKPLFAAGVDKDISTIFNKSVLGDLSKDDRFDKPISERSKEPEGADIKSAADALSEAALAMTGGKPQVSAEEDKSPADKKSLFERPVDGDISAVFSKNVLGAMSKSDRFDKSIGERAPQVEPEESQCEEESEPEAALFEDEEELESSLEDAFSNILSDPKNQDSRFDTPIQERAGGDADRFDKPIQARLADNKEEEQADDESDTDDEGSLFGDDRELESSLTDAFSNILADPSGKESEYDIPIQERLKMQRTSSDGAAAAAPAAAPIPAPPPPAAAPPPAVAAPAAVAAAATPVASSTKAEVDLAAAKNPEELLKLLEQKLEQEPNNADLWLRKGTALVQQQRIDEAIKIFDKVTAINPDDSKAWYCKGSSLFLKNSHEDALYCFNHVLKLDGDNVKAMLRKAECLVKLGRGDQSLVVYERILSLQPAFVVGWLGKARALLQQRKLQEALDTYKHVLTIEPNNEEANKAKNLIAAKLGVAAG